MEESTQYIRIPSALIPIFSFKADQLHNVEVEWKSLVNLDLTT